MDTRRIIKLIAVICCLLIITASLILGFRLVEKLINKSGSMSPNEAFSYSDSDGEIEYNGSVFLPKNKIETFLVLGIDRTEEEGADRAESQQSDFVVLVVMDNENKIFRLLHINRDTMTAIRQIDESGKEYGTFEGQLALAHTFGKQEMDRCRNTVKVIENLLYGIEIDNYLSMTMDAVAALNDSVGGVTLSLLDDFSAYYPGFTKNATVTLMGDQALAYVRERGALEDSSNLSRMERQKQYLTALFEQFNKVDEGFDLYSTLLEVEQHIYYGCSEDHLSDIAERFGSYEYGGALSLEGEAVVGDEFMEYYIDEEAARATVIDLFYDPKG